MVIKILKILTINFWLIKFKEKSYRTKNVLLGAFSLAGSQSLITIIGFLVTGLVARYLLPIEFGLWSLLISLTGIFGGLDLGFGNALRNKLAQLYAQKEKTAQEKNYFFSIFYAFLILSFLISGLIIFLKPLINWSNFFNTNDQAIIFQGSRLFAIGCCLSAINVAFGLYTVGFYAYQESHWNAVIVFLSKLAILIFVMLFIYLKKTFYVFTLMFFVITLFSSIIGFYFFLKIRGWNLEFNRPSQAIQKIKELWNKSFQFALLQVLSVFYMSADLFIVSKILGLEITGEFSLVKKLYLLVASFHFTFLMPLWSAYTEAVESNDLKWVDKILKKTAFGTMILYLTALAILATVGPTLIYWWSGKQINNVYLYILLGIWSLIVGWNSCFSVFLNAQGILKRQLLLLGLGFVLLIPLSLYLGKLYGVIGISASLILTILPLAVSNTIQSYEFINHNREQK